MLFYPKSLLSWKGMNLELYKHMLLFFWILLVNARSGHCSWIYIGVASLEGHELPLYAEQKDLLTSENHTFVTDRARPLCRILPGLAEQQMKICNENPDALKCVRDGAKLGLLECQFQFQHERWNCSIARGNQTILEYLVQQGTRETAFIHAVTTAAVVHTVTTACSTGNLTDCSCDTEGQSRSMDEGWQWGGCSDNVNYGVWFAETFVDAGERDQEKIAMDEVESTDPSPSGGGGKKSVKALVNLHNNEVGRKTVVSLMAHKCRCHGVSGSCAVRTCWKALPDFRKVGNQLKDKYETSVEISPSLKPAASVLRRREKRKRREPIPETELVYVERSPNYCRQDPGRGIFGTKGRQCKKASGGPDSCHSLCCGRGYNTQVVRTVERCQCKFIWCCEVKCKTCETIYDIHTCK